MEQTIDQQKLASFKALVKKYLQVKDEYLKSRNDIIKMRQYKAIEKKVMDEVDPPPADQGKFEFLAR